MQVKPQAYAVELYDSDIDPNLLHKLFMHQVNIANGWCGSNGTFVNSTKHQAMIIGNMDPVFSFRLQKSIELFGITVDDSLHFDEHIINIIM